MHAHSSIIVGFNFWTLTFLGKFCYSVNVKTTAKLDMPSTLPFLVFQVQSKVITLPNSCYTVLAIVE